MKIDKIDPNFAPKKLKSEDYEWHEITEEEFSIHGVYFDKESDCYIRMPVDIAKQTNDGVFYLNNHTAGGRVRFATNSSHIAFQAAIPTYYPMCHMALTGSHNFSIYVNGKFSATTQFDPVDFSKSILDKKPTFFFDDLRPLKIDADEKNGWVSTTKDGFRECEICFPLYGGVRKLLIGVKKGCQVKKAKPYAYTKPVLFYGSSITQGGCASHAGADHAGAVSRWLNTDHINLGFSGSARGEEVMQKYLASLSPSVFVLDYDYNAGDVQGLLDTHYPLYEKIRNAHPTTPIIFISKPDFEYDAISADRREVIYNTYCKAKQSGDNLVWFIDGETLFGTHGRDDCTVDTCHPTDLGFSRMATVIYPVLKEALEKANG